MPRATLLLRPPRSRLILVKVAAVAGCRRCRCCRLWYLGASQLRGSLASLREEYYYVPRYLLGYGLWDAANSGLVTLSTSFLIFHLGFTPTELPRFLFLALLFAIPAAQFSPLLMKYLGLQRSLEFMLAFGAATTGSFAFVTSKAVAYGYGCLFGCLLGGIFPLQRFAFAEIIPGGREVEMFGLFAFAGQSLGWAPPLVFIILNQSSDGNLQLALITPVAFTVGLFIVACLVDIAGAKQIVAHLVRRTAPPSSASASSSSRSRSRSSSGRSSKATSPTKRGGRIDSSRCRGARNMVPWQGGPGDGDGDTCGAGQLQQRTRRTRLPTSVRAATPV